MVRKQSGKIFISSSVLNLKLKSYSQMCNQQTLQHEIETEIKDRKIKIKVMSGGRLTFWEMRLIRRLIRFSCLSIKNETVSIALHEYWKHEGGHYRPGS